MKQRRIRERRLTKLGPAAQKRRQELQHELSLDVKELRAKHDHAVGLLDAQLERDFRHVRSEYRRNIEAVERAAGSNVIDASRVPT